MSSLKRLNHSIKLKRLEGKDNIRQVDLSLKLFLNDVNKHTKKHPLVVTIGGVLTGFILSKYRRKIKTFYPLASLGFNYIKRNN
ncbi:hypothetical protein [Psychromonas arctica]|uniref:hypothetical protein n=1 Tax=Psychromonas arctica TaxID=168275 RepID=UPI002FD4D2D3